MVQEDIKEYNEALGPVEQEICDKLALAITTCVGEADAKIWHRHPVWFLDGNPTVGYSKLKAGIRMMFWSGASFDEVKLKPGTGKFKDASIIYTDAEQIDIDDLRRWLEKAKKIQWDYKNLVKKKGVLERLF